MKNRAVSLISNYPLVVAAVLGGAVFCLAAVATASIVYQSSQTAPSTQVTYTSVTVDKPTSVASGDLMIASVAVHGGDAAVVSTVPSGWTLIASTTNDGSLLLLSYWKVAGGSETSNYEWRINGQTTGEGGITRYTGVNTSNPIDDKAANFGLGLTATTSVITTTMASDTIVTLFAVDEGKSATAGAYFSPPTGMTERYDDSNTAVGAFGPSIALDDAVQGATGSVASKSSSIGGNNKAKNWASEVIALRPAGIAFDSAGGGNTFSGSGSGPYTTSITNVGGNVLVFAMHEAKPTSEHASSMDYGGATCSEVESIAAFTAGNDRKISMWVCPSAPTGTNTLSVSYTGSVSGPPVEVSWSTYSGASSVQPDTHNQNYTSSSGSSYSATLTSSSTANDWMVTRYSFEGADQTLTAGANTVVRDNGSLSGQDGVIADSNGPVGAASSSWTTNVSTTDGGNNGRSQMSVMLSPQ